MKRLFKSAIALVLCICVIFSGSVIAFAADIAAPTNVTVSSVGASGAKISWNGVDGVKGYVVYRSDRADGGWEDLDKTTSTNYTDSKASAGKTYYYAVRAYKVQKGIFNIDKIDTDKNRDYSAYAVSERIITDPAQVKGVMTKGEVGASKLTLAWDTAEGAKGYQIYMLDSKTNEYKKIATTSKKTYTVKGLTERTTYKFKVRAYHKLNGITYGAFSNEYTVNTALADVTNFKLSKSGTTTYTLSWDADPKVAGFQLSYYDKGDADWKVVTFDGNATTTETSYTVSGLTNGGYARYRIRTFIEEGGKKTYGNWSDELVGGTLPKAPTGLKLAANTDNGVAITWDYYEGAAGYEVYCRDETGNWGSVGITTNNHFNHSNLTEKKTYEYKVRAYVGNVSDKLYGHFGETKSIEYIPLEVPEEPYPDDWQETGVIGYLYDPVEKCFYTADDTWQRNFGYSEIYDNAASLIVIIIETCRIKFEYANKDWMFQLWKGQYGWVLYGAEIGIYNKEKNRPVEHYTCATDEDMIQMQMTLWEKQTVMGKETWVRSFGRPYERQWWHTGFVWGNMIGRNKDLKMEARLTMRDYAMLDAVVPAFREKGFDEVTGTWKDVLTKGKNDSFYVNGLDIYFYWTEIFD